MDVPKRLAFTTLDPVAKPTEKEKKLEKPVRMEVKLLDSTDTTYPEFSYTDLVKPTANGEERHSLSNSEDPFDVDDADEVAAIAKRLEEKYNKPNEGKKKRKKKWQEDHHMLELGDGYDENDTFIDNSEAFDEVMPENMTTKLGGFYINSGRLIFKEMSDDSEDDFQPENTKKSKKRRISSDEDGSDSEGKGQVVKKKKVKDTVMVDGEVKRKKKKKIIPPGEGKPFKKPKHLQNKEKKKENKVSSVAAMIKSSSPNLNGEGQENGIMGPSENDELEDHQSVTDTIEAVATGKEDSNSQEAENPIKVVTPENIPKLPTSLPSDMDSKITELKRQATECSGKSNKYFTSEVNKILLEVEILSKQMTVSNRSAVFGHLAAFLPCSKETLMKRVKVLRIKDLENKIKEPIDKLTKNVSRLMPTFLERYEEECKKFAQEKLANEQKEQQEKEEPTKDKEGNQTESDEEDTKGNQSDTTKKRQTGPRKKFEWDNLTRTLLCEVVRVKMQTFHLSKARSETAEEFCKAFLDSDIRPIWPKGWMQKNVLFKESKLAHASWTNPPKTKKLFPVPKTPGSATTASLSQKSNTTSSAPPSVSVSKLSMPNTAKNNTPGEQDKANTQAVKYLSVANNSKPPALGTPTVAAPKKITPSMLNFDSSIGGSRSSHNTIDNATKLSSNSVTISTVSPKNTKTNDPKPLTASHKQEEKSWDHIVSDILRSTYTAAPSGTSPPKPSTNQQRPSPLSAGGTGLSFMAQFEKFTKNLQHPQSGKDLSATALSVAQQQLFQKQLQQRLAQDKALQQARLAEKQNKLIQQQTVSQSDSAGKSPVQFQSAPGSQPKGPAQSPMSAAMGRNPAPKLTPKQLGNVFQKSPESLSKFSGHVVKRPGDSKSGNSVTVSMVPSSVHKVTSNPSSVADHQYGRVISTGVDQLRKSSPQVTHITSQAKHGQGHVIKVTTTNQNVGQGQVLKKINQSPKPVVTNGNSLPSASLFTSPQAQTNTNSLPHSITNSGSPRAQTVNVRPSVSQVTQGGVSPSGNMMNVGGFMSGNVDKSQSFSLPSPTVSGYPNIGNLGNIGIPGLTNQQLVTLKAEVAKQQQLKLQKQQQQQQQQRNVEIPSGGHRSQQGSSIPHHLSPEQRFLALQYGFPRYKDSMK